MTYRASELAHELPEWWRETRSIYCPAAGGAGSSLMSFGLEPVGDWFTGFDLADHMGSWGDLPAILDQARGLGSDVIYLVDYWEGGYANKGDYVVRSDFGSPDAFTEGVRAVHERGGRVILYLEPFVVSPETSEIGRTAGPAWAMMNCDGSYQRYQNIDEPYYQMWPGAGSGWSHYLAGVAERLIREHDVDGFHLDSYGCQFGWVDHHPAHPGGLEPGAFDAAMVDLMLEFRGRVRAAKADAIVMMEGSDQRDLLAASDGAQDWSHAWLERKRWLAGRGDKVFTAEFGLPQMARILGAGFNLSLSPWWHRAMPSGETLQRLREVDLGPGGPGWPEQWATRALVRELWWCFNALVANGMVQPLQIDIDWLRTSVPPFPFPLDPFVATEAGKRRWRGTVEAVLRPLEALDAEKARTPASYMKALLERAHQGRLAI